MTFLNKQFCSYLVLMALTLCGLMASAITAPKLVSFLGLTFPFSNITFPIFTYPTIDCICELWGKSAARLAIWLG